ncbi:MAG: hypothetical protein SCARUB_02338 [Candidatus Scalindua rubra]|uniref:RiboL-PSP-HEPN domain-containing protein n=1 Tax=Candidatus Scalindua rubra TaxID=1872076 RepID=A0A1E3XAA2_9BACT|nr:MAG: hypothetical protein SCARUB_02338 [Candidatus Scalindua rubra]
MISDPFSGDTFVLPVTECTSERKLFFKRMNEIQSLLYVTKLSFDVCKKNYGENIIPKRPTKEKTSMRLAINGGNPIFLPAFKIIEITSNGIDILTRQAFIMFYGSFETYLYQLFEKSFPLIEVTENILDKSRDILMLKKWDGKFCKMNEVFDIGYKANDLVCRFNNFEMDFEGKRHKNPLHFLDELAQIRHRIVHASSILENDKLIFIDMKIFHGFFGFFFLLTDYIDSLFTKKFGYDRKKINPAEA